MFNKNAHDGITLGPKNDEKQAQKTNIWNIGENCRNDQNQPVKN